LISAAFWRGTPYDCLLAAEAGLYDLVISESILDELRAKLIEKFQSSPEVADELVQGIRRLAHTVPLTGRAGWVPSDPTDDKFVETALVGDADVIVSGDHHLRDAREIDDVRVLSPREFLHELGRGS
jgi:predicted nucleic acid-binding protein